MQNATLQTWGRQLSVGALSVVLGAVGGAAVSAGAAYAYEDSHAFVELTPTPVLVFTAGNGDVDRVSFRPYLGGIELEDTLVRVLLDPDRSGGCAQLRVDVIRCPQSSGIAGVRATLSDGDDTFTNRTALPAVVQGDDGDDTLTGGAGVDRLSGSAGQDTVEGGGGADVLDGGPGNDILRGGDGADVLEGGAGRDNVYGDADADRLTDDFADDNLFGGDGNDHLVSGIDVHGGPGNDTIVMDRNMGEYWGDEGIDTIDYSRWGWVSVSLDGNANDTGSAPLAGDGQHNVHGDIDWIIGSPGNDRLVGHDSSNRIEGRLGDDILYGRGGSDFLDAGPGHSQQTHGDTGFDTCVGFDIVVKTGCDL